MCDDGSELMNGAFKIKNTMAIADALANTKRSVLSSAHISQALAANNHFIPESISTSGDDSLYD